VGMVAPDDVTHLTVSSVQVHRNGPTSQPSLQSIRERLHLNALWHFLCIVTSEPLSDCVEPIIHRFSAFS